MKGLFSVLEKAYDVMIKADNGKILYAETVKAKNAGKAKYAFSKWEQVRFIKILVRRNKADDLVLFEGNKTTRHLVDCLLKNRAYREEIKAFSEKNKGKKVLIYSGQWGAYWRANSSGYTTEKINAGIYEMQQAVNLVYGCGYEKMISLIIV